ncbi:conserved hypothetical protein [Burkholderia pseudomallei 1106b]|nr:conserved hypothetical protein [Burkholderia pseudomallei 668]EEH24746.1 conserved hypothetical protein [Burkholderia pseudomallei Pakistan 9]EES22479.1 conserved hypothetical protein [Burkholderia pseudomallei 1106b]
MVPWPQRGAPTRAGLLRCKVFDRSEARVRCGRQANASRASEGRRHAACRATRHCTRNIRNGARLRAPCDRGCDAVSTKTNRAARVALAPRLAS